MAEISKLWPPCEAHPSNSKTFFFLEGKMEVFVNPESVGAVCFGPHHLGQTAITFEDGTALPPSTSSLGPYILGITTPSGPYLTPVEMLVSHERKLESNSGSLPESCNGHQPWREKKLLARCR
jgi:hypothetical protein